MSDKVIDARETIEPRMRVELVTETDRKFFLAFAMVLSYFVLLLVPLLTSNADLFQTVAATISGPIGTVIGYYFGTKK